MGEQPLKQSLSSIPHTNTTQSIIYRFKELNIFNHQMTPTSDDLDTSRVLGDMGL